MAGHKISPMGFHIAHGQVLIYPERPLDRAGVGRLFKQRRVIFLFGSADLFSSNVCVNLLPFMPGHS